METKERLTDADLEKLDSNIADVLLGAAGYLAGEDKKRKIIIKRGGRELFSFTIEPLDEKTFDRCRRENLKNKGRRNEELDGSRFVAQLIYEATIDEDKKRLWRNREVWTKLNVASGADVIQKVLTPAERAELEQELLNMVGFGDDLTEMIEHL